MQQEKTAPLFRTLPRTQQKPILTAAIREAIENRARAGLIDFSQFIDPAQAVWYRAAHLRRIASVLERVERGELKNVIIAVPPRHWKSSIASEKFPAWYLAKHPDHPIIGASNTATLAEKYSRSVREIIDSNQRYKALYPEIRIRKDNNSAADWLLETGYRSTYRAIGTGGTIPGFGFKLALLDDVSDPNKQQSKTETEGVWEWFKNVLVPRAEPDAAIVVINNRTGIDDLTGYLLDAERNDSRFPPHVWAYIEIPAQAPDGSFLWVDRFGAEFYQSLQNDPHLWRVQYQQQPTLEQGNKIKRDWFEYVPQLPIGAQWKVRAWDCAFTEKQSEKHDPDFTATVKACVHNDILYLGAPRLFRKSIEGTAQEIVSSKMSEVGVRYGMGKVAIKASVVQALTNAGFSIEEYKEQGDKIQRATAWINRASQGYVKMVGTVKEWEQFTSQWWSFPSGHDDAVDAVSGAAQMLNYLFISTPKPVSKPSPYAFVDNM